MGYPGEGIDLFFMDIFGGFGYDIAAGPNLCLASGATQPGNPAYAVTDLLTFYPQFTNVPQAVIQAYINVATASLMSSRWREQWPIAMALYVAHFLTLYAQSAGDASTPLGAVAAKGLETGIIISQSAGPVSFSAQTITGLESWGAWTKTTFGTQLATMAQVVGAGMIYIR
ncbi:DUF4054 domain-containing protein [Acidobacteria bacterium AB60]|nr:DUF4054 domain-containing protein [Acidobacteria bacterium AB60]